MHTRCGFFCFREKKIRMFILLWPSQTTKHSHTAPNKSFSDLHIYFPTHTKSKLDSSEWKNALLWTLNLFWSPCQMDPCHWTKPGLRWQQLPNHFLRPSYRLIGWSLPNDSTSRWIQRSKHDILTLQKRYGNVRVVVVKPLVTSKNIRTCNSSVLISFHIWLNT